MRLSTVLVLATLSLGLVPAYARAETPTATAVEEARQHYKRGVDLYGEANYTAALIEFRRAYEIAPNFSVLYNIGQIHYQLHDYADSLRTFQAYLSEGGNKVPSARRAEVEREVAYLRDRVGYVEIATNVEGAEVMVDGVSVGKSPFTQPVIVTVGRRRLELMKNDRVIAVKALEVAAGDHTKIELNESVANTPTAAGNGNGQNGRDASSHEGNSIQTGSDLPAPADRGPWPAIAWTATGLFAVGTVVGGVLAVGAASDLKTKRETEGTKRDDLDSAASKTKTLALVADIFGIATVLAAGTATYLTFSSRKGTTAAHVPAPEVNVRIGAGSAALVGTF